MRTTIDLCGKERPTQHYSFLMSQKSSCFAAAWDLAPCPHSQCLFRYVLLMPTKFSCLAAAWDLAPCPHFHYLPNDLLHHQAGDRKGKVSNFRWLWDRKIGSGILSSSPGTPGAPTLRKVENTSKFTRFYVQDLCGQMESGAGKLLNCAWSQDRTTLLLSDVTKIFLFRSCLRFSTLPSLSMSISLCFADAN